VTAFPSQYTQSTGMQTPSETPNNGQHTQCVSKMPSKSGFNYRSQKNLKLLGYVYFLKQHALKRSRFAAILGNGYIQEHTSLHNILVSTNLGKRSIRHKASKFWNSLPDSLKVTGRPTSKQFQNKLKIYLQSTVISNNGNAHYYYC